MGNEGQYQSITDENKRWLDLLQAIEDKYRLLEYDITFVAGKIESVEEINNPKPTGQLAKTHVLYERYSQRSYIEQEYKSDESTDRSTRRIFAFDGTTSTKLNFKGKGSGLGDYFQPIRCIGNSPLFEDDSIADFTIGLDIFPGFYNHGRGLVYAVQNSGKTRFVEKSEGILEIHFFISENIAKSHRPGILPHPEGGVCQDWKKVVLDMSKGGIITDIEGYTCWPNDPNEYVNETIDVQYYQIDNGDWMPLSAIELRGFLSKKIVRQYEYKNILYNHFDPDSNIERFQSKK